MLQATSPLHFAPGSYKLVMPNAYSLPCPEPCTEQHHLHKGAAIICSSTQDEPRQPSSLLPSGVQQLPRPRTRSPGGAVPSKSTEGAQEALGGSRAHPTGRKARAHARPTYQKGSRTQQLSASDAFLAGRNQDYV